MTGLLAIALGTLFVLPACYPLRHVEVRLGHRAPFFLRRVLDPDQPVACCVRDGDEFKWHGKRPRTRALPTSEQLACPIAQLAPHIFCRGYQSNTMSRLRAFLLQTVRIVVAGVAIRS
ncbi:hypothetical protein BLA50215_03430 [Burkholderia lata]|nr:hypothetical protein BLA50215_03430 [Burkholderia lata]